MIWSSWVGVVKPDWRQECRRGRRCKGQHLRMIQESYQFGFGVGVMGSDSFRLRQWNDPQRVAAMVVFNSQSIAFGSGTEGNEVSPSRMTAA